MEYLMWALIGLVVGVVAGRSCEGNRWADNAKHIQRIEWRGRLFKVEYDTARAALKGDTK